MDKFYDLITELYQQPCPSLERIQGIVQEAEGLDTNRDTIIVAAVNVLLREDQPELAQKLLDRAISRGIDPGDVTDIAYLLGVRMNQPEAALHLLPSLSGSEVVKQCQKAHQTYQQLSLRLALEVLAGTPPEKLEVAPVALAASFLNSGSMYIDVAVCGAQGHAGVEAKLKPLHKAFVEQHATLKPKLSKRALIKALRFTYGFEK